VLLSKLSLKALHPLPTLFPEAAIFDCRVLFERHRVGFTQIVQDWGSHLGLPDFFLLSDRSEAAEVLRAERERERVGAWDTFS
jgi:hypothetical protein